MKTVIIILLSILHSVYSICDFCKENFFKYASFGPHPTKDNFYVEQGLSCNQIYLNATRSTSFCNVIKQKYKICCSEVQQTPTKTPVSTPSFFPGINKICMLCRNGKEPKYKNTFIESYFINGTCSQLYYMGLTGNIEERLCYPLQLYSKLPCGCDDDNQTCY